MYMNVRGIIATYREKNLIKTGLYEKHVVDAFFSHFFFFVTCKRVT